MPPIVQVGCEDDCFSGTAMYRLLELRPKFLKILTKSGYHKEIDNLSEADGVMFLCPMCYEAFGEDVSKTHMVICWQPHVPQNIRPRPGRWHFRGTGYHDLTLVSGSSSILLMGCGAHFFVRDGKVMR